jgi:hypothetical protein
VVFAEYVLKDEMTGGPIKTQDLQVEWHDGIEQHDRIVIITSPECGKTQQVTIGQTLWRLGRAPDTFRGILGAKTKDVAGSKFISSVMKYVTGSREYQRVFPGVRRGKPWSPKEGMTVERRPGEFDPAKDPTLQATGPDGSVLGSRATWACFDDLIDIENTRTEYRSDKVLMWILLQVETRMSHVRGDGTGINGKMVLLCNAWEEYDAGHKLAEQYGWKLLKTPIARPETATPEHPHGLTRWPLVWPQERVDTWPPATVGRVIHTAARAPGDRRFKLEWIRGCKRLGRGLVMPHAIERMPTGCFTACGVDLGTRKKSRRRKKDPDLTVFYAGIVGPAEAFGIDPTLLPHRKDLIVPLCIEAGRWTSPEIKARLESIYDRYGCKFLVEDNAAQVYLVDDLHLDRPDIVVEPFTTDKDKWHPEFGVEGIAIEMSMQMWAIPSEPDEDGLLRSPDEVEEWVGEMLGFNPDAHTGDRLMASYFLREAARNRFQHEVGSAMTDDEAEAMFDEIRRADEGVSTFGPPLHPRDARDARVVTRAEKDRATRDDEELGGPRRPAAAAKKKTPGSATQDKKLWGELEALGIGGEEAIDDDLYGADDF